MLHEKPKTAKQAHPLYSHTKGYASTTAHLLLPLTVVRGELLLALHETVAKHEHHRVAFAGHQLGRRVVELVQDVLHVCDRFAT